MKAHFHWMTVFVLLKAPDGCDYKCTYWAIPEREVSPEDSLQNLINALEITKRGIIRLFLPA